jgi:hypothetical protein
MSNRPKSIEEVELWKLRAMNAERRALSAEIQNGQHRLEMLNKDFDENLMELQAKYSAQILNDGTLQYNDDPPVLAEVKEAKEEE